MEQMKKIRAYRKSDGKLVFGTEGPSKYMQKFLKQMNDYGVNQGDPDYDIVIDDTTSYWAKEYAKEKRMADEEMPKIYDIVMALVEKENGNPADLDEIKTKIANVFSRHPE